jgi:hypothetical protein
LEEKCYNLFKTINLPWFGQNKIMKKAVMKKKRKSVKEKIAIALLILIIAISWAVIGVKAAMTWDKPARSQVSFLVGDSTVKLKTCGNGKMDPGEDCDGDSIGNTTFPYANNYCIEHQAYLMTLCGKNENCKKSVEDSILSKEMLASNDFQLGCKNCLVDLSGCFKNGIKPQIGKNLCGDGIINPGEECDRYKNGLSIDYSQRPSTINGVIRWIKGLYVTCVSLGFDGGQLGCDYKTCTYDTSACVKASGGKYVPIEKVPVTNKKSPTNVKIDDSWK